ncbi:MAG: hypothetical protein K8R75_00730 [Deltaproteobacteria bacterium]|nr:hypothetical protein [Deltaproteobacteria bacterium]
MITENMSDMELKKRAIVLLNETLGAANTIRFLSMYNTGRQDYMEIRDELFKEMSARHVFEEAADFWERRHE